jgi:hypothetical protein
LFTAAAEFTAAMIFTAAAATIHTGRFTAGTDIEAIIELAKPDRAHVMRHAYHHAAYCVLNANKRECRVY